MAKWFVYHKKANFKEIGERLGVDQVVARILVNRDLAQEEEMHAFLHPETASFEDGRKMKDMAKAVSLLKDAILAGTSIRIIGDYDIDGIQATYILHQGLLRVGAKVSYGIPHRVEDGYGLNVSMIEKCVEDQVGLLITCDNGIAASEAIQVAKDAGITVIVTDHHEVPYEMVEGDKRFCLPPADAIVNPKQADCAYPFKQLCGAAVAWKVVEQLYAAMEIPAEEAERFLENAAFATVGDVMELVGENRTIVARGLKKMQQSENLGTRTLVKRCGLDDKELSAYHIGFVLGPCINASGRLDSATKALELLETTDAMEAAALAETLVVLNEERKVMTEQGVQQAKAQAEEYDEDKILVLYLPEVHESIAGIIAGRIRERFEKPTFVLVDAADGNGVKGSGRSTPGFSMYEEMTRCKELFIKYGGHPMAAGLSLEKENVDAFRQCMNETQVSREALETVVHIDVPMPFSYISKQLIGELELLEPFGNANPKPVFAQKNVTFFDVKTMGKTGQFLRMQARGEDGCQIEALYFGNAEEFANKLHERGKLDITYYPQVNSFRNQEKLQIVITGIS